MIRGLVLLVAWFAIFPAVVNLSGAWQSQAHPTPGVQVMFKDGSEAVGSLSRGWDRRWLLEGKAGAVRAFGEGDYTVMSFPARGVDQAPAYGEHWRAWVPPLATGFVFMAAIVWPFRKKVGLC